ncbi:Rho-GTPase-activating protein RGD2 [Candida viswanathii]|uniref:Rho-GTPase-activating protein RGD2 n=1 Tax=Candida viswanathii TaxID=5486 RepID=A0A367Y599_9ASCO|nr:Rho-GTPase-activating protein RGD2 [Candida viswanathii]
MSFAENFWTQDYHQGFEKLFLQLHQGILENNDFIKLFEKRMELEMIYGNSLESIASDTKPTSSRQLNDDYVSTIKNTYTKMNENFYKQGQYHLNIAENIESGVLQPFEKWCKEHEQRVRFSEYTLNDKYKLLKLHQVAVDKIQKKYFNKCRMLEEFKSHFSEQELQDELKELSLGEGAGKHASKESTRASSANGHDGEQLDPEDEEETEVYLFTHAKYDTKQMRALLRAMLSNVPMAPHKVPILGTYQNVSTGSSITQWLLENMPEFNKNLDKAEVFGQDLIRNEFLRVVGSMGKSFINSSQFYYQWKDLAFQLSGVENEHVIDSSLAKTLSFRFDDVKEAMGVNTVDFNDKSQLPKLISEVNNIDTLYLSAVVELDKLRCEFEELAMDHLTFMQKCELDRLKAIKKVTFDFLSSFANRISNLKTVSDELVLLEETINPVNDLKFLIENYGTGRFKPVVTLYDNYYDSNVNQTFGVDLNVKARLDKKVVPYIIQCILSQLDNVYPDVQNDEERVNLWTQPIHLSNVHKLRFQLNELQDPNKITAVLKESHPLLITNVLKLYFMELPDSIIPHSYYDVIKLLYTNYHDESQADSRINGLQNVLSELPKCNLATLDAILTHLNRLVSIIGTQNKDSAHELQHRLAKEFGSLVLRPKIDSLNNLESSYLNDKFQVILMNDLFDNKQDIFNELRRQSSTRTAGGNSVSPAISRNSSLTRHDSIKSGKSHSAADSLAAKSKSRLESRLQSAVKNQMKKEAHTDGDKDAKVEDASKPASGLKRSPSPKKKKLNVLLDQDNGKSSNGKKTLPPAPVTYRPSNDIIFDKSPNQSAVDLSSPPKFAPSLERKSSVKDMAKDFENRSTEDFQDAASRSRSVSPTKGL